MTLIDDIKPFILSPPTPTTVTAKTASTIPDLRSLVQVDEDCDYTLAQSPAPGSPVSGSSVVVTFVATDGSGNSSDPFEMTLLFSPSTEYDALTFTASGGCTGDGIAVSLGGLTPGTYSVIDKVDNQNATESMQVVSNGNINYVVSTGLSEGVHTITLLAITKAGENPYFINRSASVYVGNPSASISNLLVSSTLGNGVCVVNIKGTASGLSFVFTGPNGYVFSNVFRNNGTYNIIADGVKEPGQYLLTASFPPNSCGTSTFTQTIDVGGVKCTD